MRIQLYKTRLLTGMGIMMLMVLFSSCEKVIDLDLNSAEKKYVIEAVLTDIPGQAKVTLTQTKDFDEDNTFPGIDGATVTITENGGPTTTLVRTSAGVYEAPGLTGVSGRTYTLSLTAPTGEVFTAVSTMPQKVLMDTIYASDEFFFGENLKVINVEHPDPIGLGNSYRYIQYVNGQRKTAIQIRNDEYSDGRKINSKLFDFDDNDDDEDKIKSGDQIRVDFLCIDPVIYKYWFSLIRSATGGSQQATPANPVTNVKGGALGYFSAHTFHSKTMIVP
ncbi:DUF4249 domain-containing protein [Nostoc ellipsosporum NOK]|nr:DUF4249 domain-containing protein [Nostoc ellipsosporum NOK]